MSVRALSVRGVCDPSVGECESSVSVRVLVFVI